MKPYVQQLPYHDALAAFCALEYLPYSLLLDSADLGHKDARYSFILSHPVETIEHKNGETYIMNWDTKTAQNGNPFDVLQARLKYWRDNAQTIPDLPPFQGGAAGLFGYDLGRSLEDLPTNAQDVHGAPDMAVGIYDSVIAYDHAQKQCWIITHADDQATADRKQGYLLDLIEDAQPPAPMPALNLKWQSNFTKEDYESTLKTTINYIRAGDIFQANIAQRFDAVLPDDFEPFAHYLRLRQVNAAPFAAYMNLGEVQISSASPERFLQCGGIDNMQITTQPIKGTRAVSPDAGHNQAVMNALQASPKDRAENTMIVDLLRNDLSKCCTAQSIQVTDLCALETFASVHHLVSTVRGTLTPDKNAIDALRACFPGGSITGAPKIRAQQIIEELEPSRRGPYCGSIGYIGFDGAMDTNILIRTLVYEGGNASLQSGGGIVVDSNPVDEYQETLDKAQAMFNSFSSQ